MEPLHRHLQHKRASPLFTPIILLAVLNFVQQGQELALWASAPPDAPPAALDAEADAIHRAGSSGRTAVLPPTHLRGTDLTFNCDVMLVGDICITASHVVGRGLRNKGWGAAEQSFPHEASFLTFVLYSSRFFSLF